MQSPLSGPVPVIVSKKDGLPSAGYWPAVPHDREDWERALGNAKILD